MSSKSHVLIHQTENKQEEEKTRNESIRITAINSSVNSKQITPVISLKTKSVFKVNSLTNIKNNSSNEYTIVNRKFNKNFELINCTNPIINYDYT